ncbi:hypothetical protein MASR1M66_01970 [Aminivibrio sp.]
MRKSIGGAILLSFLLIGCLVPGQRTAGSIQSCPLVEERIYGEKDVGGLEMEITLYSAGVWRL